MCGEVATSLVVPKSPLAEVSIISEPALVEAIVVTVFALAKVVVMPSKAILAIIDPKENVRELNL